MLSWIERKAAATLFATPPTSTAEEALSHFLEVNNFDLDCVRVLSKILPKELRTYSKIRTLREAFLCAVTEVIFFMILIVATLNLIQVLVHLAAF